MADKRHECKQAENNHAIGTVETRRKAENKKAVAHSGRERRVRGAAKGRETNVCPVPPHDARPKA